MGEYFAGQDYGGAPFELFSTSHVGAILALIVLNLFMVVSLGRTENEKVRKRFRYGLAALLIVQEISLNIWYAATGQWDIGRSLPLHLCGAAIVLSAIVLVNKSYALFEIAYFWGLAGAIQPILTPDIDIYGFPHYRFFQFFVSHGAIVTANIYMVFVEGFRPVPKSILKALVVTNAYALVMFGFNWLVDGNYLFICHKPETPSLLDLMGPWPWYLIPLELLAITFFLLFYAPYAILDWTAKRKATLAAGSRVGGG